MPPWAWLESLDWSVATGRTSLPIRQAQSAWIMARSCWNGGCAMRLASLIPTSPQ